MTRLITIMALLIVKLLSAQTMSEMSEGKIEKALLLWQQTKNDEAKVLFKEVTESDAGNWLPYYYLSLLYTGDAFEQRGDEGAMKRSLETAQQFQDKANNLQPENAEVLIIQARILTGWILVNPMVYGRQNSADAMYILNKAAELEPENPRVALEKVLFDIGKAKYFGQDTQGFCVELQRTKELFATFKPETTLHPDWGREKLAEALAKCNQ